MARSGQRSRPALAVEMRNGREMGSGETALDALRAVRIDIYAEDWNGNYVSTPIFYNPAVYDQIAKKLNSNTIYGPTIASDLGMFSGITAGAAEIPEMVILIWDDPAGFVSGIESIVVALAADHGLMADLIASLPESAKERQRVENPYSPGTGYYDEYATGWYSGYFAFQIVTIFAGKEVLETVKSSQKFAQLTAGIATKMDDISRALKVSGRFGIPERVGLMLMDESASSGIISGVVGRASTVAKKTDVNQLLKKIPEGKLDAFSGHENKLADFISLTGDDGVRLINAMDDATLNKLFSLSVDGVTDRKLLEFRAGLVRMKKLGVSDSDITKLIDNTYSLQDTIGINRVIDRISTANDPGNFKGAAFELEYAASRSVDDIIEMGKPSELGLGKKPGDVDIIMREGYKTVGYELKDRSFATWSTFEKDIGEINAGFKDMVQEETLDDYMIMFRERPPNNLINWLNSNNIPWDNLI